MLALNKKIDPIKNTDKTVWSQKNTKNVLERAKETKQVSVSKKGFAKHMVETGETIYSIARLYNVSVTSLAKLNKLDAEFTIYVGQTIIVPITQTKINLSKDKIKSVGKKSVDNKTNSLKGPSEKKNIDSTKNTFIIPVKGKIISKYNPNNEKRKNQGIDLSLIHI